MKEKYFLIVFAITLLTSCQKEFLEKKPNTSIVQPQTLEDLEKILDNEIVNRTGVLPHLSSDEYFIKSLDTYNGLFYNTQRNAYTWESNLYDGEVNIKDWNNLYEIIFYANSVLDELIKIKSYDEKRVGNLKGWALFIRAYAMYDLVKNFSPVYDESTANKDLGVPIRLTAGIDEIVKRSSVQETYDQIFEDLNESENLLISEKPSINRNRPSKTAVYALRARIFLSMGLYDAAEENADKCLTLYDKLTDFNTVSKISETPFSNSTAEVIFYSTSVLAYNTTCGVGEFTANYIGIDTVLLNLYESNDLRKSVFFSEGNDQKSYKKRMYTSGGNYPFTGLATDEVYLVKAECAVRRNDINKSLNTLNRYLDNRYEKGKFTPINEMSKEVLLKRILNERRKELVWRGLRWSDLKRLNKEGFNITISRDFLGKIISLPPNDMRYVFPVPSDEINLSHLTQNP